MIYLSNRGYFHIFLSNILYLNLLDIVKNYLIKIWISSTSELVGQINWTTEKKAEDFCKEITESLPYKFLRATIEEKDERANETTR
jgi:hypothetical protein|tara:strand:+ start:871 stop:1128 length:258 start_codon:yes stop_codon:yes gene_type:complete